MSSDRSASEAAERSISLGEITPAGTRQTWRRSALCLDDGTAYVGTATGDVLAVDAASGAVEWRADLGESVVALEPADDELVAGTRGEDGLLCGIDRTTGKGRWSIRTADDLGEATRESLFYYPFVVGLASDDDRVYAAARRYERRPGDGAGSDTEDDETSGTDADGDDTSDTATTTDGPVRHFESAIYALDGGTVRWRYDAPASPIALDARDGRVVTAYNRCPGAHRDGIVALRTADGEELWRFDPPGDGQRRAGDVALLDDGVAVASHADYRGYLLSTSGDEQWRVDLGRPTTVGDERLYTYPTRVRPVDGGVAFVTGNTFPTEGRQATGRHPREHTVAMVDRDGVVRWRRRLDGWVSDIVADEGLCCPVGQHFREADPDTHGIVRLDFETGAAEHVSSAGAVVAIATDGTHRAWIEKPVEYHDAEGAVGRYRLHLRSRR